MLGDKMKKALYSVLTAITIAFTIWYMHFGICYKNEGALSKIGLNHRIYFAIWGILTFVTLAIGICTNFKKHTKHKFYIPLLVISAIGMAMTLAFRFDFDIKPDYYLHCIGSLLFSVVMGVTIFLLYLMCYKKGKIFKVFCIFSGAILLADFVLLLIFKETGLIEVVPIFAGYIMLNTTLYRRERIEATR